MTSSRRRKAAPPKVGVIKLLQEELNTFGDQTSPLLDYQHERLKQCLDLLENPASVSYQMHNASGEYGRENFYCKSFDS
ncbi:hypothetical protein V6Z88_003188 [Aspergillus fumigatus]